MRVLVACEHSGTVRDAFLALGHDAYSCDLLPSTSSHPDDEVLHYEIDVLEVLEKERFDLLIAHPPCTFINSAGLHWIARGRIEKDGRPRICHKVEALEFVSQLWTCNVPLIAVENPMGCINTSLPFMPKPQYVQPYDFGDDASKKTGLWLKGLSPLVIEPSKRKNGRMVEWPVGSSKMVERWSNQTDSGQNNLGPSADRWALRSLTYPGIAKAMAEQFTANRFQLV